MKFDKLKKHQKLTASIIVLMAISLLALASVVLQQYSPTNSSINDSAGSTVAPNYGTILPVDKSINNLGGWRRVSPPKSDPVFAFTDKIGNVRIDVSEQPLPDSFKSDPQGKVEELAQSYAATDKIIADDTTIYVGTSIKGPQSAILTKFNLLILIKSQKKIDSKSWTAYANSLNSISDSNAPKF